MWDSTVPMIELAMRVDCLNHLPWHSLPAPYGHRCFQPGDERAWARIEMSAGEFTCLEDGLAAFRKYYPSDEELDRRMIFLTDGGVPFATATAWFDDDHDGRLHWVSVDAPHQGRGLSRPLVSLAMHRLRELGHVSAMLTTQTASWVAIRIYHEFGFRPMPCTCRDAEGWRIVSEKTGIPMGL